MKTLVRVSLFYVFMWFFLMLLGGIQQETGLLPPEIGLVQSSGTFVQKVLDVQCLIRDSEVMSRLARLDAPGVLHHVMGRGIERKKIFFSDIDRKDFIGRLSALAQDGG